MEPLAAYYDGFRDRLLDDYRCRNARVVAALEFAAAYIAGARRILDIGCGIGWSSAELSDRGADVTGIDISPVLIATARDMFGDRATFKVGDIARAQVSGAYDAVVMIDVYEHIPCGDRPNVHAQIARVLRGGLLLTVPTPEALQWARDHNIALQPVDEDVTDDDIAALADAVGGDVLVNSLVSIWRPDDYRHVLIRNA